MTIEDAYIKFLIKLNKNLDSNNVSADPSRFVIAFNENSSKRIVDVIGQGNDEDLREIESFLVSKELSTPTKLSDRFTFTLPKDYLDFSSQYAIVSKGKCKNKVITDLWEIKDKNSSIILSDVNNKPSFEWEEAPFLIANNKVQIFASDFEVNKVNLTYYKYPRQVDIEGYITSTGGYSTNIDPEGDDKFLNKVISMTVEDFQRNYENVQGVQISKDRIINNN